MDGSTTSPKRSRGTCVFLLLGADRAARPPIIATGFSGCQRKRLRPRPYPTPQYSDLTPDLGKWHQRFGAQVPAGEIRVRRATRSWGNRGILAVPLGAVNRSETDSAEPHALVAPPDSRAERERT